MILLLGSMSKRKYKNIPKVKFYKICHCNYLKRRFLNIFAHAIYTSQDSLQIQTGLNNEGMVPVSKWRSSGVGHASSSRALKSLPSSCLGFVPTLPTGTRLPQLQTSHLCNMWSLQPLDRRQLPSHQACLRSYASPGTSHSGEGNGSRPSPRQRGKAGWILEGRHCPLQSRL